MEVYTVQREHVERRSRDDRPLAVLPERWRKETFRTRVATHAPLDSQLLVLASLYGFGGSLFVVIRKATFHHDLTLYGDQGVRFVWYKDLRVDRGASSAYFEVTGFILLAESFILAVLSELTSYEGPWSIALITCTGTIAIIFFWGMNTQVVDNHGTLTTEGVVMEAFARLSMLPVMLGVVAYYMWPVLVWLSVVGLGIVPLGQLVYLISVMVIPFFISLAYLWLNLSVGSFWFPEKDFMCTCGKSPRLIPRKLEERSAR